MRSKGAGTVWVHVCKSRKTQLQGRDLQQGFIGQAKKKRGVYHAKQKFFDYPAFWLNRPGTYYWQAHRIDCSRQHERLPARGPGHQVPRPLTADGAGRLGSGARSR